MKTNFERGQLNAQDDLNENFEEIKEFMEAPTPLQIYFGKGSDLPDVVSGTPLNLGSISGIDMYHSNKDLPFDVTDNNTTLTMKRDCALHVAGVAKIHGDNSINYTYVKIRRNGVEDDFIAYGTGTNFNYQTYLAGAYVFNDLKAGDKVTFTVEIASGKKLFRGRMNNLVVTEIKVM